MSLSCCADEMPPDFYWSETRKARKSHICEDCRHFYDELEDCE